MADLLATQDPFGKAKAGANIQRTWVYLKDTLYWLGGASLADQAILSPSGGSKASQYKSQNLIDLARQRHITLKYMRVTHNLTFAMRGTSEPIILAQQWLENFCYFQWTVGDKIYDPIPLAATLPYDATWSSTTIVQVPRLGPFFELPEPIEIPSDMQISFDFKVPSNSGLTLAAEATTNPYLPGLSIVGATTTDHAWWMKVDLIGEQDRPVA